MNGFLIITIAYYTLSIIGNVIIKVIIISVWSLFIILKEEEGTIAYSL